FASLCADAGIAPQHFVTRNDVPCGSTIGPIAAARVGIPAVDVGNPMLSMHSCREMAGSADVAPMVEVLRRFYASEAPLPRSGFARRGVGPASPGWPDQRLSRFPLGSEARMRLSCRHGRAAGRAGSRGRGASELALRQPLLPAVPALALRRLVLLRRL